jgi:hypothetical protein
LPLKAAQQAVQVDDLSTWRDTAAGLTQGLQSQGKEITVAFSSDDQSYAFDDLASQIKAGAMEVVWCPQGATSRCWR